MRGEAELFLRFVARNEILFHMTLDATDLRLLDALQKNAALPRKQLAELCHISQATCSRRMAALEKAGYIARTRAILKASKLGFGLSLFVMVRMESDSNTARSRFESRIKKSPLVQRLSLISGEYDYMLHVVAHDMEEYHHFVESQLTEANDVKKYLSLFEMKVLHDDPALPLGVRKGGAAA